MRAADDADDVVEAIDPVADVHALADRILVREVLLDERLVDNRDVLAGRRVLRRERAAAKHRNRERFEVARRDHAIVRRGRVARLQRRPPADVERQHVVATERQRLHGGGRLHAGLGLELGDQIVEERVMGLRRPVRRPRQRDLKREHALRLESRIDVDELVEAAQQQRRARQQHDRQRDLRDEQHAAHPAATGRRGRAAAFLEHRAHAGARRLPRGRQAEEDAGHDRRDRRKREHRAIDPDVGDPRNAASAERLNRRDREITQQHAQ